MDSMNIKTKHDIDRHRLQAMVDALTPEDDLYHAALDICAKLHDDAQAPEQRLTAVIEAINDRFL